MRTFCALFYFMEVEKMEFLIGFVAFGIIAGIICTIRDKKIKKAQQMEEELLKDDILELSGSTLRVNKSNKNLKELLVIKKHEVKSFKYNEEQLHFGAVSVGGVTTGGVYKTGGDVSVTETNSDRYELIYKKPWAGQYIETKIETITLSDELAQKAKGKPIEKYLNYYTLYVVKEIKPSETYTLLMKMGKTYEALSLLDLEKVQGYPTKEECTAIIDFLCDEQ